MVTFWLWAVGTLVVRELNGDRIFRKCISLVCVGKVNSFVFPVLDTVEEFLRAPTEELLEQRSWDHRDVHGN